MAKQQIAIRIDSDLHKAIKTHAQSHDITMTEAIESALEARFEIPLCLGFVKIDRWCDVDAAFICPMCDTTIGDRDIFVPVFANGIIGEWVCGSCADCS